MQFRHKTFTIYNKTTLYYIKTTLLNILDRVGVIDMHTKGRQSRRKVNDTYLFLKEIIVEVSKLKTLPDQRW